MAVPGRSATVLPRHGSGDSLGQDLLVAAPDRHGAPSLLPQAGAGRLGLTLPLLALAAMAVALYTLMLPMSSADLRDHFLPWQAELAQRGAAGLSGEFADYTPPYLYLLFFTMLLAPGAPPAIAVKLIGIGFTLAASVVLATLVRDLTGQRRLALLAGFAFPLLPTVALNAAWWGQCDIVYTTFLLGCFAATLHRRPALAMLLFGIALSFKLQSMFLAPYLALLALRREIGLRHLALPFLAYAALMVPAWLAGRPAWELATIYLRQGAYEQSLAMSAPNPWLLAGHLPLFAYSSAIVLAGVALTAVVFLLLLRRAAPAYDGEAGTRVVFAVLCLVLAPFLLPKMHDRYFFAAEVFSLLLVCLPFRELRSIPVLLQAGSLSVYAAVLSGHFGVPLKLQGVALMSVATAILLTGFLARTSGEQRMN